MFKTFTRFSLFLVVIATVSTAYATNGMRMIGFGPVQRSMGGVSVGLPLDAASVLTNPAGMTDLKARVDFGASYFVPTVEYEGKQIALAPPGAVIQNEKSFVSDRGPSPIPALGLVVPIREDLKFGLGAYGIAGMGVDYPQNVYGGILYTSYSQMRFAPGFSYRINDMISVGAVLNVMYATMEYDVAAGFGQVAHMGAASFGYGATFGIWITPVKMISLGIAYETESVFQDFEFNTPAHTVTNPDFSTTDYPAGKDKLEFNQPQSATIGLSIAPIAGLLIGVDVQWIRWSDTNGEDLPEFSENSGSMTWNLDWEDQYIYKVGIQYSLSTLMDLRVGYNYGKMPLNKDRAFENIAFPAVSEHHITAGVGIHFRENFAVNIGGMYSPESSLKGKNPTEQFISSYETSMSQYSLDFGFSYTF